jgi:hypothetical protein
MRAREDQHSLATSDIVWIVPHASTQNPRGLVGFSGSQFPDKHNGFSPAPSFD